MSTATMYEKPMTRSRKRKSNADAQGVQELHDAQKEGRPKQPKLQDRTDLTRWRIKDDDSRHTWHYLESEKAAKEWPQSTAEQYFLNLPLVSFERASKPLGTPS